MTNNYPHRDELTDEDIIDEIRDALEAGERDKLEGGIAPNVLAERVGRTISGARDRCRTLADNGKLVEVDGIPQGGHRTRKSYLPVGFDE